ncbi:hypothetical protein ACHQM5_010312 [Ranunculus cassubicifolius]
MSGGFFRGTSADQDTRFSNKQAKLMKSQKFAPELDHLVDMSKVKMDVVKPWIATRVTEFLGFEDEVLINFIYGLLDGKEINGKEVQIQITGFMEKNTGKFMKELWNLLLSAQKNASGVPQQFLDAKEEEIRKKKAESDLISQEIQRKKEIEHEKQKKMDEEFAAKAVDDASDPVPKYSTAQPDDDKVSGGRNGPRKKNRSPRSPRSSERPASPRRIARSGSISKSFSNSRSYSEDSHKSRSRSLSPQSRRYLSPRKRSLSPRRKYSPRRYRSPLRWRSPHSRRMSPPYSRRRSPTPRRRRSPSPMRRSSPSLRRRRSPVMRRRRSPTPVRRRSPSPVRRRSPPPMRRRSPTLHRKSPSPVRSRSPLATRRRSPTASPSPRRSSPSPLLRHRSPSPPARRRSPLPPVRRRSPSPPVRRRSPSPPVRRRSPSPPPRRRSPSPPARRRSPSPPARRRPPSSPLTRRRSPSPVRRRSPRQRRRSPLRLPTQKYRGGSPYRKRSPAYQRHRSLSRDHDVRNNGAGPRRYQDDYRPKRAGGTSSPLISGKGEVEDSGVDSASRQPPISLRSPQRDPTDQTDTGRKVPAPLPSSEVSPCHSGSSIQTGKSSASEDQRDVATYASSASPARQTLLDDSRRTVRESRTRLPRVDEGQRTKSPERRVGHSQKEGAHRSIPMKDSQDEEYSPERSGAHQLGEDECSVDDIGIRRKDRDNRSEKASLRVDSLTPIKTTTHSVEYSPGKAEVKGFTSENAGDEHKASPREGNNVDEKLHSHLRDVVGSGIDSENEHNKSKGLERKKHKRHDRHHSASEDDSGYDSHIDERKDAKRRRKEEKRLRKEEKRRRREERHRKKEERRAGKLKAKAVDTDKNMSDADDSDDHAADTEERENEQKKLEIELRKKALESLRAKKAINP